MLCNHASKQAWHSIDQVLLATGGDESGERGGTASEGREDTALEPPYTLHYDPYRRCHCHAASCGLQKAVVVRNHLYPRQNSRDSSIGLVRAFVVDMFVL